MMMILIEEWVRRDDCRKRDRECWESIGPDEVGGFDEDLIQGDIDSARTASDSAASMVTVTVCRLLGLTICSNPGCQTSPGC